MMNCKEMEQLNFSQQNLPLGNIGLWPALIAPGSTVSYTWA